MQPMWFYSQLDGYVYRTDTFNLKNISTKLSNYASPDELVAVIKKVVSIFLSGTGALLSNKNLIHAVSEETAPSEKNYKTLCHLFSASNSWLALIWVPSAATFSLNRGLLSLKIFSLLFMHWGAKPGFINGEQCGNEIKLVSARDLVVELTNIFTSRNGKEGIIFIYLIKKKKGS